MQKTIKLEEVVSENQDNEFSDSVSRDSYNNLQCQNENLQLLLSISKETCSDHELKLIDFKYQISNLEEQISNLKRENKQSADIIAVRNNIFNNLCDTIQNLESKNNYSDFYRQFPPPDFNSVNIGCPVAIVPFPPAQLQVNSRIPQDPRNRPSQQLINNPIDSQTSNDINGSSAFQINSNVFDWKNDSSAEGQIALMKLEWKMLEPSSSKADINLSPSLSLVEDGLERMNKQQIKLMRTRAKYMSNKIELGKCQANCNQLENQINAYQEHWILKALVKTWETKAQRVQMVDDQYSTELANVKAELTRAKRESWQYFVANELAKKILLLNDPRTYLAALAPVKLPGLEKEDVINEPNMPTKPPCPPIMRIPEESKREPQNRKNRPNPKQRKALRMKVCDKSN